MHASDPSDRAARRRLHVGLLLGFVAVVLFGGSLPATRAAVQEFDPLFLAAARTALAGLAAALVLAATRRPLPAGRDALRIAGATVGAAVGFPICSSMAMLTVPAGHGGVVLGIMPLATAVFAALIARERPSMAFWLWGVAGAVVVVVFAIRQNPEGGLALGDLWLIGAMLSATVGYVLSAQVARRRPGWEVASWTVVFALPIALTATGLWWPADLAAISPGAWVALGYVGLIAQFAAFFFWNAGLAMGGIARVGQVQLLQIFTTIAIAALWNGEPIAAETVLFAAAVAAIVMLGQRTRVRRG